MALVWEGTGAGLLLPRKPAVPTIAWGQPLTNGLVFCADYSLQSITSGLDLVNNTRGTYTSAAPGIGPFGGLQRFSAGQDAYTTQASVNSLSRMSVEILFNPNSGDSGNLFGKGSITSTGGNGWNFFNVGYFGGNVYLDAGFQTTDPEWFGSGFVEVAWNHLVLTYDGSSVSNVPSFYRNGLLLPLNTNTSPVGARVADNTALNVFNNGSASNGGSGACSYVRVWNRILSPQEASALARNPWAVYRSPPTSIAVNVPSGNTNVNAAAATATGAAAAVVPTVQQTAVAATSTAAAAATTPNVQPQAGAASSTAAAAALSLQITSNVSAVAATATATAAATTPTINPAIAAVAGTAAAAATTPSVSVTAAAAAATAAAAALLVGKQVVPTAVSATATAAPVVATVNPSAIAAASTGAAAAASTKVDKALAAVSASAAAAAVSIQSATVIHLTGVSATGRALHPVIWSPVGPPGGGWTPVTPAGGNWTPVGPVSGSWTLIQ